MYRRERINTPDGDFLDLDWAEKGRKRLLILSHGLEGSSTRGYMRGMANYFFNREWDVLAWNCRSCSGEMNRLPRFYHHADIDDLSFVIDHAGREYDDIYLAGFSMGGNMILNYLGKLGEGISGKVKGAAVFSVPLVLYSSVQALSGRFNRIYRQRFLKKLGEKIREKSILFPDIISYEGFEEIEQFPEFDNRYTAPLHGFRDAQDFYTKASPRQYLSNIKVPCLIVNAKNDPFLGKECYPLELAKSLKNVFFEMPSGGGHVGFTFGELSMSYMEYRADKFYQEYIQ